MDATYERLESSKVKISFSAAPEDFENALNIAYRANKNRINIPGFRKGKITRQMAEMFYGKDFFYQDAVEELFPELYEDAINEFAREFAVASSPGVNVSAMSLEEGVKFEVEVYVEPEVEINNYKGFTYKAMNVTVTDEDVENELEKMAEKNSRIVPVSDREAQMGDTLLIDYTGYIDGEKFDGGSAQDYSLTLGSKVFIEGFEDKLAGHKPGDAFKIEVKFPDVYHMEKYAGKPAVFDVLLKEMTEKLVPEIDDEFAQDISDFDTLEEYKESLRVKLLDTAENEKFLNKQEQVLTAFVDSFEAEIPECMTDTAVEERIEEMGKRYFGIELTAKALSQFYGMNEEEYINTLRSEEKDRIKLKLGLLAIAKLEDVSATDDDVRKYAAELAEAGKADEDFPDAVFEERAYTEFLRKELLRKKGFEILMDSSIMTEEEEI